MSPVAEILLKYSTTVLQIIVVILAFIIDIKKEDKITRNGKILIGLGILSALLTFVQNEYTDSKTDAYNASLAEKDSLYNQRIVDTVKAFSDRADRVSQNGQTSR